MAVIDVEIRCRESYAKGQAFGDAGAYERLDGRLTIAVDPQHAANIPIVDLDLAPRDVTGRVQFQSDFTLLVPQTPTRGNRRLIVDVVNRGRKRVVQTFNRAAPTPEGSCDILPGDGFLFRQGYAVVSVGWQWDVYRSDALLGLQPPHAEIDGQPVHGQIEVEIRPSVEETTRLLADRVHQPYPAADLDDPHATLYVQDWKHGPLTAIPRDQWCFGRETADGVVPSHHHIYVAAKFQPGKMYRIVYTTQHAPIVGAGLLAVRDVAVWLRHNSDLNPVDGGFQWVYGYGVSQTGRMLRNFISLGLNVDEENRMVFDGLLPHIAGGRQGEFNHRFGQPSQQHTPSFGHRFPFADNPLEDPFNGQTAGLLDRLRERHVVPKIIYTNSSAEYWRGDASLTHIDPTGHYDLEPTHDSRLYHFASTQHVAGSLPQASGQGADGSCGRYPYSVVDYRPLLRAALINLDRWVSEGIAPPPNCHPRLDDGSAITRHDLVAAFTMVPEVVTPDPDRLWSICELDLGPESDKGIGQYPAQEGRAYPCHVAAIDRDGNEIAGIRLPDLTVPVGTHTGWNPRDPETGSPEQMISMQGFSSFFAPTQAEREAAGDQRLSLEERYDSRDAYLIQVQTAAEQLVTAGYLLGEDVGIVVDACAARYDVALGNVVTVAVV